MTIKNMHSTHIEPSGSPPPDGTVGSGVERFDRRDFGSEVRSPPTCAIELIESAGAGIARQDREWVLEQLGRAVGVLQSRILSPGAAPLGGECRVTLIDDDGMTRLHQEHLGIDAPTDVLTFDLTEGGSALGEPRRVPLDVDVYVCVPEARRQAEARSHSMRQEVLLYSLHGLLHALGFNDLSDADYEQMHRLEDEVLERLGIGRTFHSGSSGSRSVDGEEPDA